MVEPVNFEPRTVKAPRRRRRLRPTVLLLWLVLVALGGTTWFVFTGRTVEIAVQPTPEQLQVKGRWPAPVIDHRYFLHRGRYTLTAELEGHRRLEETIEIDDDTPATLRFTFEPLPGRLRITSGELTGAEVLINGEVTAVTPAEVELPLGVHAVVVRAPRHSEAVRRVEISEPDQRLELAVVLEPGWAPVHFRTVPAGASVVVDGHRLGVTPLTAEIGAGRHDVELRLPGYAPHSSPIAVVAREELELPIIRLARSAALLKVTSVPTGASVTVDDEFQGTTPLEVGFSPDAEHEITLTKGGFEVHTESLRVAAGQRDHLTVELIPLMGQVRFTSRPPGAEVIVDGENRGRTDTTLELEERPHTVEIRLDGHVPFTTTITPRQGAINHIDAELESVAQASRPPERITSPQGVELKLIAPGRFTMGASRRVPGRRANETLREVVLTRPYYLAVREVTNREYRAFKASHRSGIVGSATLETDHHPVVRVTWDDAARYCNWLSEKESLPPVYEMRSGRMAARSPLPAGYRLPTEAEWAWAARYDGAGWERKYQWGGNLPIPSGAGNFGDRSADGVLGDSLPDYDDGHAATAPAGSFTPNPRGLFNMGGNVSEWVQDLYTIYPPQPGHVVEDPTGPDEGEYHVIRGASWMDDSVTELRLSYRDYGDEARPDVGFRIARSAR
jgi:formylglycine-generating enzyme required for sulfatase activity